MKNDKTIVDNPSVNKYDSLSLFTLEFDGMNVNSTVHIGNREQSDERFFKYIREIHDNLSIDSLSSPFYAINRYFFDSEDNQKFIDFLGIDIWPENNQTSGSVRLSNYIKTVGFHPEDKIYLRDASFTLDLKPEISGFNEFKSDLKEISKILGNKSLKSVTNEMLNADRNILLSKIQPVIKEKNRTVDTRQDKEQKTDPVRTKKIKKAGKLKM